MDQPLDVALQNLELAIKGRERGVAKRFDAKVGGFTIHRAFCEVLAADVLAVAGAVDAKGNDAIVNALIQGCMAGRAERSVCCQVDDIAYLLERYAAG